MSEGAVQPAAAPGTPLPSLPSPQVPPPLDDITQSWFFAETLAYLYLLQAPDAALDLERWVLSTEAHPLLLDEDARGGAHGLRVGLGA